MNQWPEIDTRTQAFWLKRANTVWGAKQELILWALRSGPGHSFTGHDEGRASVSLIGDVLVGLVPNYAFGHEVGHTLGLPHCFDALNESDPKDLTLLSASDAWDLMYTQNDNNCVPGQGSTFYSSRSQAETAESQGKTFCPIEFDTNPGLEDLQSNCTSDANSGNVECIVNATTYQTGAAALKGLGFQLQSLKAPNIMSYLEGPAFSISDSQIELLQRNLRYERPLDPGQVGLIAPPGGMLLNADRVDLGTWDVHRNGGWLNFDGTTDTKRDLAVWDPPAALGVCSPPIITIGCGKFRILRSFTGHDTAQPWNVDFGKLGDVPFVQDYNGDGCTDIGVWRTNGPNGDDPTDTLGYFVYCQSSKTGATCNQPNCHALNTFTAQYGFRTDVPIHDPLFVTGVGKELAVFRPSTGTFHWVPYVQGGSNNQFPLSGSVSKTFGGARYGSAPISGDFDNDGKGDPAIYNPMQATFEILPSGSNYQGWSPRQFSGDFIPADSDPNQPGSPLSRAGGFAIETAAILTSSRPAVYFPYNGTWSIMWDVATPGSPLNCIPFSSFPGDEVMPFGGPDRDGDWRSDYVAFYAPGFGSNGSIRFKNSNWGDCNGVVSARHNASWDRPRMRPFAVHDATGDGKPDIILLDPDTMTFYVVKSELSGGLDYNSSFSRQVGNEFSVPL